MIEIRIAKKSDISAIASIFSAVSLTDVRGLPKNSLKNYMAHVITSRNFVVFVAEENSRAIGFCICQLGVPMPDVAYIVDLDVSKKAQGKGVGQKLMAELYKYLKKKKMKNVGLYSENIPKTIKFYEKQGFRRGRTVIRFDRKL